MTRVAFDTTPLLGTKTGIGNVVQELFWAFDAYSEVEIVPYTLSLKARTYRNYLDPSTVFVPYPARILLNVWKISDKLSLDRFFGDIDVVHATNYLAPPTNHSQLITIHDVTMLKYPELVTPTVRSLAPIIQRRLQKGAHVHVPSNAIKTDVQEHFKIPDEKVHVIGFAMPDLEEGTPSAEIEKMADGDDYIISIGSLEPRKNHARLIEAFGKVKAELENVRLIIVGPDGPARPQIDEAMAKLDHQSRSRVIITGPLSNIDRTYLLKHARVLAYPSIYEGFGLVLLEAMSCSVPIVTTKEGSLAEIAQNSARFVDHQNADDIADGLISVMSDDQLRDKLIDSGNKRLSNFSWKDTAKKMCSLYNDLAKASK